MMRARGSASMTGTAAITIIGSTQTTTGGSGGGVTQVASLPPTCTTGTSAPVQLTVANGIYGAGIIYYCSATNTWTPTSQGSGAGPTMGWYLSPQCPPSNTSQCFYTYGDTQQAADCGWTTSNGVITCTGNHFTAADVGKSVMGFQTCNTDMTTAHASGNEIAPNAAMPTITTYNSPTSVTISATPANAMTIHAAFPPGGCLVWGHIDDSGFSALSTAVQAASQCPKVFLAAGNYLVTTPPGLMTGTNPPSCAVLGPSTGNPITAGFGNATLPVGFELEGRGVGPTQIFLSTNFPNGDSCQHVPNAVHYPSTHRSMFRNSQSWQVVGFCYQWGRTRRAHGIKRQNPWSLYVRGNPAKLVLLQLRSIRNH